MLNSSSLLSIRIAVLAPLTLVLLAALIGGGAAVASAQQGDTFEEAIPISEAEETGSIDGTSTFYTLEANGTDALDVEFTAESDVLEIIIYDRNRKDLISDGFVDSETTQLTTKLPSTGTYYIEVAPYEDSSKSDYTLNTNVITPTENDDFAPNDDFDSAAVIDQQFTDAKIWGGESDFYRLEANTTDALDVRLTPQNADLEFTIYDQNRESIASDGFIENGDTGRVIKKLPANSTYYVEVGAYSGSSTTSYTLNTRVITPTENDDFAPNDNFDSAASTDQQFIDAKIWGGESDFYRVEANTTDALDVRLTPQNADLEFTIYNQNRESIASDGFIENGDTGRATKKLPANGTYYIEVMPYDGRPTTGYTLNTVVVTPADNDAFAPNDGFDSAAVIEQEFSDATIWGGESDFYRVGLNSQEDWAVDLTTQQAEMEFSIYAPNGTQLASDSYVSDTDELSISASQAGSYYVEVTTRGSATTTDYTIQSTKTGDPQSDSAQVQLTNVRLTPQSVDSDSLSTHQLMFRARNVSADGSEDEFDITFPDEVELVSYSDVAIDKKISDVNRVDNTLEFSVNPTGGGSTQISGELNVTVSATN